jgi:cyclase
MTLARRILSCLDTDGSRVVMGVHFEGLRDAGDPVELGAGYNAEGADELVVLDIVASRDNRPTFLETIQRVAERLTIPLTAGGGIRSLADARAVIRAGADKFTVNTAAVERPALLTELSNEFGSQAVVLAIDAKRGGARWEVRIRGGREFTGLDAETWARGGWNWARAKSF